MVSHRRKPNSAGHHFRPTEATIWKDLTLLGSSMALLQVHFSIFAEWHIAIYSAPEPFFYHCDAACNQVGFLLFVPFLLMLLFFSSTFLKSGYAASITVTSDAQWFVTQIFWK